MAFEKVLGELDRRRKKALAMGGEAKLAKRREEGHLNARERLDALLDADSFIESGMLATSHLPNMREKTPADGKIAGYGKVAGRGVAIVSNDFTVVGASSSVINGKKIRHMREVATKRGLPMVFLGESTGARMPDRMGAQGRAILGQDPAEYLRNRKTPWVSAQLGACYGSSTWYGHMSDFVVMRKGATMAVASGKVTSLAINQPVDSEELGGWRLHADKTGRVDMVVDTDEQALEAVKRFLSYVPSHNGEAPPVAPSQEAGGEADDILKILPESSTQVYDVRKIIAAIADRDSLFELKGRFGKSITTMLARLDGHSVGFLANNTFFKGGAIDVDACNKAISFLVLCDSYNIPVVFLVDQPGFMIGLEGELRGAAGRIINWMNALSLMTVPKISVIMRKSYGQAYLNMGGGKNSDEVLTWPTADLGFMAPEVGVNVLYGVTKQGDPERFAELVEQISRDSSAWQLAELYEGHEVIDPRETRHRLIGLLEVHRGDGVGQHVLATWPTSY
ncbi:acyl-CoA carboxylase subunit beta [Arvimicrobium flavum]|uniref:acyl-CoA carboxylase subunit beta n=1 Tax=Arvimicrobium flavum TaxID=3393320 RepID=UPI00237A31B4|nr:carboxyl transferase domain-containing protein [Mesorhizobium shangrilense]